MFASPEDLALGPSLLLTLWVALHKSLSFSVLGFSCLGRRVLPAAGKQLLDPR